MEAVATAVGIMTGLGLFFATVLAVAYRFLRVEEDPRLEQVTDMLPGTNCGACGEPGCGAFAKALILSKVGPAECTVSSAADRTDIAEVLGVDVGEAVTRVARLKCAGAEGLVGKLASYQGRGSCRAAAVVDGGGRACPWGCLGLGDCEESCDFDAIAMGADGLPHVSISACVACNDCVDVCPLDLFVLAPLEHKLFVQCNSPLAGDEARALCAVACDACGRCAADAPAQTVTMQGGLPVIDFSTDFEPGPEATFRCPTSAIVWLEGAQFEAPEEDWEFEGRRRA